MHKARFAEWLLRSVTDQDRAVSTVGDLLESAPERGQIWFWSDLLRTFVSQTWQGMASHSRAMGQLVFRAWCMGLVYTLGYQVLRAIADVISIGIRGHALTGDLSWWTGMTATVAVMLLTGRWIGRRAPAQAMLAGLVLCFYSWAFAMGLAIARSICHLPGAPTSWQQWIGGTVQLFVYTLPFLAGALMTSSVKSTEA